MRIFFITLLRTPLLQLSVSALTLVNPPFQK
jgi:hypothetical protein